MSERRLYETTFIVNAALEDNDIEAVITKVLNQVTNNGGNIQEINKWGRRRLAYPINKKHNGFYVHALFEVLPEFVPQLERYLTLDDTILRHLTLQVDKKLLELRAKRAMEEGQESFVPPLLDKDDKKEDTVIVEDEAVEIDTDKE
ncbi:MAG: 30S ribosomal protein S6 [Candidatus Kapaibacteriota bacterium]